MKKNRKFVYCLHLSNTKDIKLNFSVMDSSLELKKFHIMEYLMNVSDLKLLEKVEKLITESGNLSKKEMIQRASIAEQQLADGKVKTNEQAKERLSKWMK